MSFFFVTAGADRNCRFDLDPGHVTTLGREEGNVIQLHDTEVSRRHAKVVFDNSRFVIVDLNSSNGTFVNGHRVTRYALTSGDQVLVGSTQLQFRQRVDRNIEDSFNSWVSYEIPTTDRSQIVRSMRRSETSSLYAAEDEDAGPVAPVSGTDTRQANAFLRLVCETATALKSTVDVDQLMEKIMELIFQWINPDRGCVLLVDPQTQKIQPRCFRVRKINPEEIPQQSGEVSSDSEPAGAMPAKLLSAQYGFQADDSSGKLNISQTILDYVMTKREGVLTRDASVDSRFDAAASIIKNQVNEAICVPLDGRYGVVGAIYIDTSISGESASSNDVFNQSEKNPLRCRNEHFDENHLKMMIAIAHHAAIAVEDTRFYSAMIQSERLAAIGQTVASLSHHIKNILQGISGGSYLIEAGLKDHNEELISKGWGIVERNQSKISGLVMDMLSFSKERAPEPVMDNINDVITDVYELMLSRAKEYSVTLSWNPNPLVPEACFDRELVSRAVLNLVTNAIDAASDAAAEAIAKVPDDQPLPNPPPKGEVEIVLGWDEEHSNIRIQVLDNGAGIPEDMLDQVFNPFFSSKGAKGTGLGLPVVQKVVREHNGTVKAIRRPEGGTCFQIDFPFKSMDVTQ